MKIPVLEEWLRAEIDKAVCCYVGAIGERYARFRARELALLDVLRKLESLEEP